jgi:hypothetical protein
MKAKTLRSLTLLGLLVGFGWLAMVLPYSSDDLMWSGQEGLRLLHTHFYNYNGRVVSNLMMIAMGRYLPIRILIFSLSSVGIIWLITRIVSSQHEVTASQLLLTTGLLMTMSQEVFSQTFGWLSGFINYVTGMIPLLVMLLWALKGVPKRLKIWQLLAFGILGVVGALFVEHVTLYLLGFGVVGIIICAINRSRKLRGMIAFTIGTSIGAFRMFSDPSYLAAFAGNNRHRHLSFGQELIKQLTATYTQRMSKYLFEENVLIVMMLSVGIIWLIWHSAKHASALKMLVTTVLSGYSLLTIFSHEMFSWLNLDQNGIFANVMAIASLVFLLGILIANIWLIDDHALRVRMWLYINSALVLSAPFAVITPYGSRCAFGSLCFILIAALDIFNMILKQRQADELAIRYTSIVFGAVTLLAIVLMMSANGFYNLKRTDQLQHQAQLGKKALVLPRLPFDQLTWNTAPTTAWGWGYPLTLKNAGLNPKNYQLTFVPFKNWHQ